MKGWDSSNLITVKQKPEYETSSCQRVGLPDLLYLQGIDSNGIILLWTRIFPGQTGCSDGSLRGRPSPYHTGMGPVALSGPYFKGI